MLELTVELSKPKKKKRKEKSKHPQLTVAFLLTLFQMNVWLFTCGGKKNNNNLRLTKIDMEKRDGMQNKNPLGNHNFFFVKSTRGRTVQYLSALTEKQQWLQIPAIFYPRSNKKKKTRKNYRFPFLR